MGDVVEFKAPDTEQQVGRGRAKCFTCLHEWEAVAPVGTEFLDCPLCAGRKGSWMYPFIPEEMYVCNCGNKLFYIVRDGWFCPNCGVLSA